jgi:nucleoside-diphosphate-sugar epimerase
MGMTGRLLIFGMGYSAGRLATRLRLDGWEVTGIRRQASGSCLAFDDTASVRTAIVSATHILSSVPPLSEGGDAVLLHYGADIAANAGGWIGYLSATGVYGDTNGAWVDESAAVGIGRRTARAEADKEWQRLGSVFRLPGIYGPGRSALDRVQSGKAHRIDLPDQVFSRVHVDDIVSGVIAGMSGPRGCYNLSDDHPSSQNAVIDYACTLLNIAPPPMQSLDEAKLSPMAAGFYGENRRISNRKAKRLLGWTPVYSDYKQGLDMIFHSEPKL